MNEEMNLEEIISLEPENVTNEQRAYLVDNKDQLSDDDVAKFGLDGDTNKEKDDGGKKNKANKEEDNDRFDVDKLVIETRGVTKEEKPAPNNKSTTDEEEDDDDIDPVDKKVFDKMARKYIQPLQEELAALKGNTGEIRHITETDNFIAENPEYKKYRAGILKVAKDPAYARVAISFIAAGIAAKDLKKIGAQMEREAQEKAKGTQNQGNQGNKITKGNDKTDPLTVPISEHNKRKAQILGEVA